MNIFASLFFMTQSAVLKKPPREAETPGVPYRILPHNQEAEQGLLGALLVDNRAVEKVGDFLKAVHFFMPAHQRIYDAIIKMIDRGQTASPVTLKNYFENVIKVNLL